jgi:septum formation protein
MTRPDSIVLESASPRRRRLIGWLGLHARLTAHDLAEDLSLPLPAATLAATLASDKALAARAEGAEGLVLGFDTIVVLDGVLLGKPADLAEARRMLESLSGRMHEVITGVALLEPDARAPRTFSVTTRVLMHALSDADIDAWVAEGELLGCAGAYNIERHLASVSTDECFQNVAGLPLCHLYRELATGAVRGVPDGLTAPVDTCDSALGRRCALGRRLCELR